MWDEAHVVTCIMVVLGESESRAYYKKVKRLPQIMVSVIAWLIGLTLARQQILVIPLTALVVAGAGVVCAARWRTRLGYVLLASSFCIFGLWRGQLALAHTPDTVAGLIGQKVTLTGRVVSEPGWNDDHLHEFVIGEVKLGARSYDGTLKVKALAGHTREGEIVEVTGKVGRAHGTSPAQIWYGDVCVRNYRQPYPVRLKGLLAAGLAQVLPSTQAGFIRGLIFGSRSALPPELETVLQRLGLTHIVAVSGFNLTVIVAALSVFVRRQTRLGYVATLAGISFFTVMAGASASIVRAAVMAGLFLSVARVRRQLDPRIALLTSVFLMTAWDPAYLYRDLGWQLSVLALSGVLWLSPVFLSQRERMQRTWRVVLAATLGAYIATAPIIAYTFGTFSVIAPLANLIVLPVLPTLMLLGYIASLIGVLSPQLSWLCLPLRWLLGIFLESIEQLANLPWANVDIQSFSLQLLIVSYVGLVFTAIVTRRHASAIASLSSAKPSKILHQQL